jgi:hypothetical protein
MDITYYASLAEIIGTIAIVISLIYVAVQIRQSNQHMAHEAQRSRAQAVRENLRGMAGNAEIFVKEHSGEALTAAETHRMNMYWMGVLFSYQTSFQQLPRSEIIGHANFIHRFFETSQSIRATWEQNRDTFHPDFTRFMEENVIDRDQ